MRPGRVAGSAVTGIQPFVGFDRRADDKAHPRRVGKLTADDLATNHRKLILVNTQSVTAVGKARKLLENMHPRTGGVAQWFRHECRPQTAPLGYRPHNLASGDELV